MRASKNTSPRSDIYSVGVLLYEALGGRPPFQAESLASLIIAIITEKPPPLAELRPDLDPGVLSIVERAMASDPSDRFADADEMKRALQAAVEGSSRDEGTEPLGMMSTVSAVVGLDVTEAPTAQSSAGEVVASLVEPAPELSSPSAPEPVAAQETPAAEVVDAPAPAHWPKIAGGLAVLTALALGGVYALDQRPGDARNGDLEVTAAPSTPALPDPEPAETRVRIELSGVPDDATISVDGERIAQGAPINIARDHQEHAIQVQAEGHELWEQTHRASDHGSYEVALQRLEPSASVPGDHHEPAATRGHRRSPPPAPPAEAPIAEEPVRAGELAVDPGF